MYFIGFGNKSVLITRSSTLPEVDLHSGTGVIVVVGVDVGVVDDDRVGVIVLPGVRFFVPVIGKMEGTFVAAGEEAEKSDEMQDVNKTRLTKINNIFILKKRFINKLFLILI